MANLLVYLRVCSLFVHLSIFNHADNGFCHIIFVKIIRDGHFHVKSVQQRLLRVMHAAPVRYRDSLKSPLFAENFIQKIIVMAAVRASEFVICSHNAFCLALLNCCLKSRQIDFTQCPFTDFHIHIQPSGLLIVGSKMLHA